ncbi:hypothetical protein EUTSA_v10027108mg [Eutrema salsugineum]|uniref:LOB domain-containing protein n=1 Tax=Eutrema salsugineum TaxID=72664 RepID=V4P6C1_EUTSA|nr:hypothetical protein EUTSA_v10027108mg [Eutrema salsugineum]
MASNPCSAYKVLKSVCIGECAFIPYFPSTESEKFDRKILNNKTFSPLQREHVVNALSYKAEASKTL